MEKFEITPHVEKFEVWSWRLCGLCWFYAVGKVLEMVTHVKVRSARWVSVLILVCTFAVFVLFLVARTLVLENVSMYMYIVTVSINFNWIVCFIVAFIIVIVLASLVFCHFMVTVAFDDNSI